MKRTEKQQKKQQQQQQYTQLRRDISIVLVRGFKHEISIFICWKISGKNATLYGY